MLDLVVRIGGVLLIASCIVFVAVSVKVWLFVVQRVALAVGAIMTGGLGIMLLIDPQWAGQLFFLGLWLVFALGSSVWIWLSYRVILGRMHKYQQLARETRERGDLSQAQLYEGAAATIRLSLGRLKELRGDQSKQVSGK